MDKLYTIRTHSGTESSGKVFGLEAKHFLPILYSIILSMCLFFILSVTPVIQGASTMVKIIIGGLPLIAALGYVFFFIVGKPPHYFEDVLDTWFDGPDFNIRIQKRDEHPFKGLES